ncbi:MAG: hypothetical protein GY906_23795 [bacterium]|nr:hypothetical protein [bacterium]
MTDKRELLLARIGDVADMKFGREKWDFDKLEPHEVHGEPLTQVTVFRGDIHGSCCFYASDIKKDLTKYDIERRLEEINVCMREVAYNELLNIAGIEEGDRNDMIKDAGF